MRSRCSGPVRSAPRQIPPRRTAHGSPRPGPNRARSTASPRAAGGPGHRRRYGGCHPSHPDPRPVRWPARSAGHPAPDADRRWRCTAGCWQSDQNARPAAAHTSRARLRRSGRCADHGGRHCARPRPARPGWRRWPAPAPAAVRWPVPVQSHHCRCPGQPAAATGLAAGAPAPARPAARFPDAGSAWPGRPPGPASRIRDGRSGRPPAHRPRGGPATPRRRPVIGGQRIGGVREQPAARAVQYMQQQQFRLVAGVDAAQASTGVGYDLTQGGLGLKGHAAIVEPSLCSAASGAAEHRLGSTKPESVQVPQGGIRTDYRPQAAVCRDFPCHTGNCRMAMAGFSAC